MLERYLTKDILEALNDNKMVFISGPRQVGKTTLAKQIAENYFKSRYSYLNWDDRFDKIKILKQRLEPEKNLFIFDEIHKYRDWKNYLKGFYDKNKESIKIIVTGSAKLDIFRKSGDSLLGRYYHYRLFPLTMGELIHKEINFDIEKPLKFVELDSDIKRNFEKLFLYGGFPEIFFSESQKKLRLWHNQRLSLLVKEDIRDISNVRDLSLIEVLAIMLKDKVGSLLSINSISEDLSVNHRTVDLWLEILEQLYYHFRIYPYQSDRIKSLKKEGKLYLWDYSELTEDSVKLENLVAVHLLKFANYLYDDEGYQTNLYFLRDKEQREVDFLITLNNQPWFAVEVKKTFSTIPKNLLYFKQKINIPFSYLIVMDDDIDFIEKDIRVINVAKFLTALI